MPIKIDVRDVAMFVGSALTIRGGAVDRRGNVSALPVSSLSSAVAIAPDGTVRGVAVGRTGIYARSGIFADTLRISVVPNGTIAAIDTGGVVVSNLDGSGIRRLFPLPPVSAYTVHPTWLDARSVIVTAYDFDKPHMLVVDMAGTTRALLTNASDALEEQMPRATPDGRMVYYLGRVKSDLCLNVWQLTVESGVRRQITQDGCVIGRWFPSPSPDGVRVAFLEVGSAGGIVVKDALTMESRLIIRADGGVNAGVRLPRWSPDGETIAYLDAGDLWLARPDGSQRRFVLWTGWCTTWCSDVDFAWSPDSKWIILRTPKSLSIVRVSDGEIIPLPFTSSWQQPTWQP